MPRSVDSHGVFNAGQEETDCDPRCEIGMKKKSTLALSMTSGLEVVMTPWAGVAPVIEAMRHNRSNQ